MPKLAIYVPKKDMRQIEKWRKKINFSRVFMRALMQEIRDRSRDGAGKKNQVAQAAAYYKRRLVEDAGSLGDIGYDLGQRQVLECRIDPETIRRLLEITDLDATSPQDMTAVKEALRKDRKQFEALARKQQKKPDPTWRLAVYRGYLRGVAAAWQRVCDEMKA